MLKPFLLLLLLLHENGEVEGFCRKFPFGHLCRNMDLTGFCLQVSHMIRIRKHEKPVRPYLNFEKLFDYLEVAVGGDVPYVYFGGYKRPEQYHAKTCLEYEVECEEPSPPGPDDPTDAPPVKKCLNLECQGPNQVKSTGTPCPDGCKCCLQPPDDTKATGTIFSLQDGCELKYMKAPIIRTADNSTFNNITEGPEGEPKVAMTNPYHLEISEISINKVRLHNWLHIRIHRLEDQPNAFKDPKEDGEFGKGNIKLAFVMVHDAHGFPVGEFVNNLPCGSKCNCSTSNKCYQANRADTIPCMFDSRRVITNTGMMIVISPGEKNGTGYKEIHGSWRFSQSRSPDHFHTELHFHALIVDDYEKLTMLVNDSLTTARLSAMAERRILKEGIFGWNPMYTILHPTNETVGAYDYYREGSFSKSEIDCHTEISPKHYVMEPYPDSGPEIRPIDMGDQNVGQEHCYRLNNTFVVDDEPPLDAWLKCADSGKRWPVQCPGGAVIGQWFHDSYGFLQDDKRDPSQIYPWTLFGARTEAYVIRDGSLHPKDWRYYDPQDPKTLQYSDNTKLYFGLEPLEEENALDYEECAGKPEERYGDAHTVYYPTREEQYVIQHYGHTCLSNGRGQRVPNLPGNTPSNWSNVLAQLFSFPAVNGKSYWDDRCYCPLLPPTPNPRFREPPEVQIQGRRQHAYQMIIAWNCFVPFSIFVSRYYKETYSKVFFLQEYWWYTTHVLCMFSAAMFTFGGIYVMELKRRHSVNWLDPHITAHVSIGYSIICLFFFQVVTGFFRVKDVKKRLFNIFTHWLFGVVEYLMAIACMVNSSFILLSGMSCAGVAALAFLIGCQVMFYASMEVHMRNVDKMLKLKPPRSYLPPPVMRVFHKDAPDSRFRIYVLLAYLGLCVSTSMIQFISMEYNKAGESCFIHSKKFVEQQEWESHDNEKHADPSPSSS